MSSPRPAQRGAVPAEVAGFIGQLARRIAADAAPPPEISEAVVRQVERTDDLTVRFVASARATGSEPEVITRSALAERVASVLQGAGARDVLVEWPEGGEDARAVRAALEAAGVQVVEERSDDVLFAVRAVVTGVAAAIAETGTLVLESGNGVSRSASLVPPLHVAVVRRSQLLADLSDYFLGERLAASPPTCSTLVTGPSKTADIEGILVTGVHGPGRVVILLVSDT